MTALNIHTHHNYNTHHNYSTQGPVHIDKSLYQMTYTCVNTSVSIKKSLRDPFEGKHYRMSSYSSNDRLLQDRRVFVDTVCVLVAIIQID